MSHTTVLHQEHPLHVPSVPQSTETWEVLAATPEVLRESNVARNVAIALILSAFIMLAGISVWLWYGAHQYQNCL
jgi:hypothetical protein